MHRSANANSDTIQPILNFLIIFYMQHKCRIIKIWSLLFFSITLTKVAYSLTTKYAILELRRALKINA